MKGIDTGKDKVKKICDVLKRETLEPAKREAEEVIRLAEQEARRLVQEGKLQAEELLAAARKEMEKERNVFQSSLNQACKQALASLKQDLEEKLFQPGISELLEKPLQDPKVIAELIQAVVSALEKSGLQADLSAIIPKQVPASSVNALLGQKVLQKLKDQSVQLGSFNGGIAVKVEKENITIDVSESALKELVSGYIRKDFRDTLFRS